jgi:hypothetical protein
MVLQSWPQDTGHKSSRGWKAETAGGVDDSIWCSADLPRRDDDRRLEPNGRLGKKDRRSRNCTYFRALPLLRLGLADGLARHHY